MAWREARVRTNCILLAMVLLASVAVLYQPPKTAEASATMVQSNSTNGATAGGTSVSVSYTSSVTAGNLLVAICDFGGVATITGPSGFSTAKSESGASGYPSQGIFYKVATGSETSITCAFSSGNTPITIQIYEFSGIENISPLDTVNGTSSTGTGSSPSSGSLTSSNASDLFVAGLGSVNTTSSFLLGSTWSNSFTAGRLDSDSFTTGKGHNATAVYMAVGGAYNTTSSTGTYSTTNTGGGSGNWLGQIAAFKIAPPQAFNADIVDGSGNSVASPSVSMSATSEAFTCQTSTGSLGISTQKVRVTNTTPADKNGWTLDLAASSTNWSDGSGHTYKYNDRTGSGCTNGQLTVDPTSETITPESGCTTTGVSPLASTTSYTSTSPITIASAGSTASYYCYWDVTGLGLSQKIPASQAAGSYSIGLTMTLTAL
jgi:hypothetical protein